MAQGRFSVRRARPLLGTMVEISADGEDEIQLHHGVDRAFDAVARVQRVMSFHDSASDLSRINRSRVGEITIIDPWTFELLVLAKALWRETSGVFDIAIAHHLEDGVILPRFELADEQDATQTYSSDALSLLDGFRVEVKAPLRFDLGGIAKGFAVDKAIDVLKATGIDHGGINAGGDIRVFGDTSQVISIRVPAQPHLSVPFIKLQNGAIASSGNYFQNGAIVDPRTRQRLCDNKAVSVVASTCVIADALTKVAFIQGTHSAPTLKLHHAAAWEISGSSGELTCIPLHSTEYSGEGGSLLAEGNRA